MENNNIIFRRHSLIKEDNEPLLYIDLNSKTFIFNRSSVLEFKLKIGDLISFEYDKKTQKINILLDGHKEGFKLTKANQYRLRFRNKLLLNALLKYLKIDEKEISTSFSLISKRENIIELNKKSIDV